MLLSRRLSLLLLAQFSLALAAGAQSGGVSHERSTPPADGRYEIVQSTFGVRYTFRVDKYLGYLDQLVLAEDSTSTWQRIPRLPHLVGDDQNAGRQNYQFFTSGSGIRSTFLINVNTGAVWQLVSAASGQLVLDPFK